MYFEVTELKCFCKIFVLLSFIDLDLKEIVTYLETNI